jgi:hypothetical protein
MSNKHTESEFEAAVARLEELIKKLKRKLDSSKPAAEDQPATVSTRSMYLFQRQELGSIALMDSDAGEFRDRLLDLYHAVPQGTDQISLRAVESEVHEAVLKAFLPNKEDVKLPFTHRLTDALVELRGRLRRAPTPWWIHLEVSGLVKEELPRKVGSVEFYVRSHAASELPQPGGLTQGIVTTTYASVPVKAADSDAAKELAIRELRQTIDLLNYFGGLLGNREARVYLPWEARAYSLNAGISQTEGHHFTLRHHEWHGPYIPFYLNLLFETEKAKRAGFPRALEIASKANRSSLEERLLSAIQWAGRATVEERREEAFVLFTVALESLLVDKHEKDQITQRFAIRGAHLIGKDYDSRKLLYERLKKLYALRSKIIHSGSTEIADADRNAIAHFVRVAIFTMLKLKPFSDMRTVEEFHTWCEDRILGHNEST